MAGIVFCQRERGCVISFHPSGWVVLVKKNVRVLKILRIMVGKLVSQGECNFVKNYKFGGKDKVSYRERRFIASSGQVVIG